MKATLKTLSQESETFLKIPKFQRSYSWKEAQWDYFWRTIAERALELNTTDTSHSPIFMGAIVFKEDAKQVIGSKEFTSNYIIDGQQRFVTISVFFAALRDFYFGQNSVHYTTWSNKFLSVPTDMMGTSSRIRLTLQDVDNEQYEKLVGPKTKVIWKEIMEGSHSLYRLYSFFWNRLSQDLDHTLAEITSDKDSDEQTGLNSEPETFNDAPIILENVTDKRSWEELNLFDPEILTNIIDQQMKFAVIEILEEDDEIAFEVFETLNAHGQPLDEVDKFRNGFFMLDPEKSDENYSKYWLPMEKKVGDVELLSTFFHEETTRRFGLTPKDKTYQELMTRIKKKSLAQTKILGPSGRHTSTVQEFKDLKFALDAFMIIHDGLETVKAPSKETHEYLQHLNFLRKIVAGPATPLLMDLLIWTKDKRVDKDVLQALNEILKTVEGLLVRRLLGGIKPQQLRSLLADVPKKMNNSLLEIDSRRECNVENLRIYNKLLRKLMLGWGPERFPSDNALLANPLRDIYQSTGRKVSLFSVLFAMERRINNERSSELVPKYGRPKGCWSIEHVLPQGTKTNQNDTQEMNGDWRKDWEGWGVSDIDVNFIKHVHALGNLTILINDDNASVSDNPFAVKLELYEKFTTVKLTNEIKGTHQWSPVEIEERSKKLLNLAIDIWPYPQSVDRELL